VGGDRDQTPAGVASRVGWQPVDCSRLLHLSILDVLCNELSMQSQVGVLFINVVKGQRIKLELDKIPEKHPEVAVLGEILRAYVMISECYLPYGASPLHAAGYDAL
jgi:hypothetical protein